MTEPKPARAGRTNARSARRLAREFALQGVYAWLLRGGTDLAELGEIDAHVRDGEDFSQADAQQFAVRHDFKQFFLYYPHPFFF